ncbi:MAG: Uma2 family endonuclease [Symploca sp. SIO1A3]|nr:Uma2 family endonuclease [Symploca sp. SIO1A3]
MEPKVYSPNASPSGSLKIPPRHGREANILADIVKALLDSQNRNYEAFTPITMELPEEQGIEPDYCFYITNWQAVAGQDRIDWRVAPPPDLVLEIDVTSYTAAEDYLAYRVPEVWLFRNKSLKIYQLQQDNYQLRSLSLYFPEIDLSGIIDRVFQQAAEQGTGVALRELRRMLSM